ncbi:hypothetical protein HJC99_04510 [Candidatus Saccharibacteria bacterium]|nr:hypothetical protein [Candidatus Saccharibacteria bacterium]
MTTPWDIQAKSHRLFNRRLTALLAAGLFGVGIFVTAPGAHATYATSVTFTAGSTAQTSTTAGYATQAATAAAYKDLGLVLNPPLNTACSASTDCQFSMLVNVAPH